MENPLEIKFGLDHVYVRTPGRYAMNLAVGILRFFDKQNGYTVKNTGWKQGFGLEVCERTPIESEDLVVEIEIHLVSGDQVSFSRFTNLFSRCLNERSY